MYRIRPLDAVGMDSSAATQAALIKAATPLFAQQGYEATRTRDIADRAKANVSAINYHFGSKMGLYQAVIEHLSRSMHEAHPVDPAQAEPLDPEARLHWVIRNMVSRIIAKSADDRLRICLREFVEPTEALDFINQELAGPAWRHIASIVGPVVGRELTKEELDRFTASVIGQIYYYGFTAPMLSGIGVKVPQTGADVDELADHIFRFSLAGLRA